MTTPSSTETLTVCPIAASTAKVPNSENGMPSVTSRLIFDPRNSQQMAKTRIAPYSALVSITFTASRVGTVWSSDTSSRRPLASSSGFCCAM